MKISNKKYERLKKLSNENQIITALAIDQRGAIERLIPNLVDQERTSIIKKYKSEVAKELTKFSSSILLDPIYGLEAIKYIDSNAGLLLAYEVTGYKDEFRLLNLTDGLSVKRIAELGADAVKVLLYYDVDDTNENNEKKKATIERIGDECFANDMPFFLEIITYDNKIIDEKEFAKVKPHKVNEAAREFSKKRYNVDVLKLEVPINIKYTEGFTKDFVMSKNEARQAFLDQTKATNLPYIFLSAGVSMDLFIETLKFAEESGAQFHGVLCGRATWKDGVAEFINEEKKGKDWLKTKGTDNILKLNKVIQEVAKPWTSRLQKG